jgi:hypothetical protein
MPHIDSQRSFPRDAEALADFHMEIAAEALYQLKEPIRQALEPLFGEQRTAQALADLSSSDLDGDEGFKTFVELTQPWSDGAGYAGQGIAPGGSHVSVADRKRRIETLIAYGRGARKCASLFTPNYEYIWDGVAARATIDFGGRISLEGLRLLSELSLAVVRNAVSAGALHPDSDGCIAAEEAREWLTRRREFCPSRWRNPADNQWPFDPRGVTSANEEGEIWVPQAAEGDAFTPDRVVRSTRSGSGISITIGAKGEERQFRDFYEALGALAATSVPRWRRRNGAGNWGIVRARGAWVAVSKAVVDAELAAKFAEGS